MAETRETNTNVQQTDLSPSTKKPVFISEDASENRPRATESDYAKLVDAVREIVPCPLDSNVDTVIYQLHTTWRRQEATRIVMKRKLDKIKEKLTSKGSCTHQCGLVNENAALRKQCGEIKKRFEKLLQDYRRVLKENSINNQVVREEGREKDTDSATNITDVNKPCGETVARLKVITKVDNHDTHIGNNNTAIKSEKNSDEPNCRIKEELACLHFENDNNKIMVDRLRHMLSSFHKNVIISSGTLQVSPISKTDQAVLATFAKIPVKRLDPKMLQLWKNTSNDTGEEILIGKGAFGKVNLMRYIPTNMPVAVKIQEKKNRGISEEDMKNKLISRSMKEAVMQHVMSDNPSFPGLLGIVEIEDNLGVVLEFIGDKRFAIIHPLCDVLFERRPGLSRLEWIDIALDIVQGLASLHENGLLHNDLKKNNILMQRSGERWRAYIIDFGHGSTITMPLKFPIFTLEEEREYLEGLLYHHLAPEIIRDQEPTSVYTDIYSLGKVLLDIGRVSGDRDLRLIAEKCTREKPYRRATMSKVELSVIRAKEKSQQ